MSRITTVIATGAIAYLAAACSNPYESLAAQRMREICHASPNICENGLIVAKLLPGPQIQTPISVLRVQRFKCEDGSQGQGTDLLITAHVINVGTAPFTSTQQVSMTATLSSDGQHVLKSIPMALRAGVTIPAWLPGMPMPAGGDVSVAFDFGDVTGIAVKEVTVQFDPNQPVFAAPAALSWPNPNDPSVINATALNLTQPNCSQGLPNPG